MLCKYRTLSDQVSVGAPEGAPQKITLDVRDLVIITGTLFPCPQTWGAQTVYHIQYVMSQSSASPGKVLSAAEKDHMTFREFNRIMLSIGESALDVVEHNSQPNPPSAPENDTQEAADAQSDEDEFYLSQDHDGEN